jgi:hypothetical protein
MNCKNLYLKELLNYIVPCFIFSAISFADVESLVKIASGGLSILCSVVYLVWNKGKLSDKAKYIFERLTGR